MEHGKHLGIFISGETAYAGLFSAKAGQKKLLQSFSVSLAGQEEDSSKSLGRLLAEKISELEISYDYVGLALGSGKFVQHYVTSGFTDRRRIARTIKYDVEDEVGVDVSTLTASFITHGEAPTGGTNCTVFTSKKAELISLLKDLQKNKIDPEVIQPDSICFLRAAAGQIETPKQGSVLLAGRSESYGYIGIISASRGIEYIRSFKTGSSRSDSDIARRIAATIAACSPAEPVEKICIAGSNINPYSIQSISGIDAEKIEAPDEHLSGFEYVLMGASMMSREDAQSDLRIDFMPYQGRKRIIRTSLSALYLAAAVIVAVFAWKATLHANHLSQWENQVYEKVAEEYSVAMKGRDMDNLGKAELSMESEINRLRRIKAGETADVESVPTRLQFALEILNSMPNKESVKLDSVSITSRALRLDGSTSSRRDTQNFLKKIDSHENLQRSQESLKQVGSEDSFTVSLNTRK
ncbi:hypothetical protein [Sedimentisphaera salicampi]|uniref:GspL periplasmic domain-containing protein n=1 Tax=Sedimentisphaera salicampi TaxID=1941349 RepID=A0A1W6LPW0_9BACT|nr:hypothetical protein [Sedimentisphaera salicampi]ARN57835.1 hypothetical protein STSP1_02261 [Sedimentisphaera salicampi]OXU14003.1 hypothetical protein SMSP1_02165 [Sedimentisphaera salicampi]